MDALVDESLILDPARPACREVSKKGQMLTEVYLKKIRDCKRVFLSIFQKQTASHWIVTVCMTMTSEMKHLALRQVCHDVMLVLSWLDRFQLHRFDQVADYLYLSGCERKTALFWRVLHSDEKCLDHC